MRTVSIGFIGAHTDTKVNPLEYLKGFFQWNGHLVKIVVDSSAATSTYFSNIILKANNYFRFEQKSAVE